MLNLALVPMYLAGILGSLLAVEVLARSGGDMRTLWVLGAVFVALAILPAWRLRTGRAVRGYPTGVRRALRLAGLAVALSLWVIRCARECLIPGSHDASARARRSSRPLGIPVLLGWETVGSFPHDTGAWTQGLLIDDQGRLFESTGIVGDLGARARPDHRRGAAQRRAPRRGYGEGLAMAGDRLTTPGRDGVALAGTPSTFEVRGQLSPTPARAGGCAPTARAW